MQTAAAAAAAAAAVIAARRFTPIAILHTRGASSSASSAMAWLLAAAFTVTAAAEDRCARLIDVVGGVARARLENAPVVVVSVLDAGCGDFAWQAECMPRLSEALPSEEVLVEYLGIDAAPAAVAAAEARKTVLMRSKEKVGGIAAVLRQVDVLPFQVVDVAADAGHVLFRGSRRWDVVLHDGEYKHEAPTRADELLAFLRRRGAGGGGRPKAEL